MQLQFHPSFSLPGDQRGLTLFLQDFGGTLFQDGQVGQDGHHLVLGVGRVHPLAVPAGLQQDLDGVELQQDLAGHAVEEGDVGQSGRRQQEDLATGGALAQLCGIQSAKGPVYLFIYLLAWFYFTKQRKNDTPCSNWSFLFAQKNSYVQKYSPGNLPQVIYVTYCICEGA